jgi:uncharacterized transporter YbjL
MTTLSPIKNENFAWKIINHRNHEVGICKIIKGKVKVAVKANSIWNKQDVYRLAKRFVGVADICNSVTNLIQC